MNTSGVLQSRSIFERFKANPVRYAPQFANFCAVELARGEVREANPEYWLISNGKLYLFGKSYGPDVFRKELGQNIERARHNRERLKAPLQRGARA